MDQDIEEMADLCDEFLDSAISTDSLTRPIMLFARTVGARDEESPGVIIPSEGCSVMSFNSARKWHNEAS